ncbi:MAG: helix-turn-helix domain-containing protein [Treponema sp.]|nr:helix-turn-helix domain-containing protein [Treponema sp.]
MESYGEILKKAREEKYLDFDTISRETSITRRYIEALESEQENIFPGGTYLKGFLKSYAEYLGLDSERILQLYRSKTLQESPVPVELTAHEKPKFLLPLIFSIVGAVLVGTIVVLVIFFNKKLEDAKEAAQAKAYIAKEYTLTEEPLKEKLFENDKLILGTTGGNITLTVATTDGKFGLETPSQGIQIVELSETSELDVDGDGKPELIVYVEDVSTNGLNRGAQVDIRLKSAENVAIIAPDENTIQKIEDLPKGRWTEVFSDNRAYPFTLNATFRAETMFRYKMIPGSDPLNETIYSSGENISLTVRNGIRIGIANGNAVSIKIQANSRTYDKIFNGQDFPGTQGEIVVKDLKWIKDTDGKYKLVVIDID